MQRIISIFAGKIKMLGYMIRCTQDEFIERAKKVHYGDKIDFSEVNYTNMKTKVKLVDHNINPTTGEEYGEYWQQPYKCLKGQIHPIRSYVERGLRKRITTDEFIRRAKAAHHGENLDFSKTKYITANDKVCIIDHDINPDTGEEYGEYWQLPSVVLLGASNKKKATNATKEKLRVKTEDFVRRAKAAHPDENLDYSKTKYVNSHTDVCIIDHDINPDTGEEYGEFWQNPFAHLNGCKNPKKSQRKNNMDKTFSRDEIIERMHYAHPENTFDFSEFEYTGYQKKGKIICHCKNTDGKEHGAFYMTPDCFIRTKYGCPKCASTGMSIAENELYEFIDSLVGETKVVEGSYDVITPKQVDIYIPDKNVAIEYDGLYWHSLKAQNYHLDKLLQCSKAGIRLINVFEDEWISKRELVKDKLSYILGYKSGLHKIGARKCKVKEITKGESDRFLESNHIQGKAIATTYLGAFYDGKLVSVMLFKKTGKEGVYELNRFATDINYVVQGIASKIISTFIHLKHVKTIVSFADRRWVDEDRNLYISLGFHAVGYVVPSYTYFKPTDPSKRFHKFNFRKQILCRKYPNICSMEMTEKEMTEKLGYARIYDCGLIKYELDIES